MSHNPEHIGMPQDNEALRKRIKEKLGSVTTEELTADTKRLQDIIAVLELLGEDTASAREVLDAMSNIKEIKADTESRK